MYCNHSYNNNYNTNIKPFESNDPEVKASIRQSEYGRAEKNVSRIYLYFRVKYRYNRLTDVLATIPSRNWRPDQSHAKKARRQRKVERRKVKLASERKVTTGFDVKRTDAMGTFHEKRKMRTIRIRIQIFNIVQKRWEKTAIEDVLLWHLFRECAR